MVKKDLFAPMKLDTMNMLFNRSGKMGGHVPEVRRGAGVVTSAKHRQPKHKVNYAREAY